MRCSELKPMYCHPILRVFSADMRQNGWGRNNVFWGGAIRWSRLLLPHAADPPSSDCPSGWQQLAWRTQRHGGALLAWPLRSAIAIRLVGAQCAYAKHILSPHPPSQRASEGAARVTASTFALNVVARTRAMPFRPIVDFCRDQTNTLKLNLQSIHSSIWYIF